MVRFKVNWLILRMEEENSILMLLIVGIYNSFIFIFGNKTEVAIHLLCTIVSTEQLCQFPAIFRLYSLFTAVLSGGFEIPIIVNCRLNSTEQIGLF